ncbi:MAG: hypothetical protein AB7F39_06695 [Variibacter sp.]
MTISVEKHEKLKACYKQGLSSGRAAKLADVAPATAESYFRKFKYAGVKLPKMPGLPIYEGPDWIGSAA